MSITLVSVVGACSGREEAPHTGSHRDNGDVVAGDDGSPDGSASTDDGSNQEGNGDRSDREDGDRKGDGGQGKGDEDGGESKSDDDGGQGKSDDDGGHGKSDDGGGQGKGDDEGGECDNGSYELQERYDVGPFCDQPDAGLEPTPGTCTGACAQARCSDGVKDGSETDIDCGGGCAPCAMNAHCTTDQDCASGACASPYCPAPPSTVTPGTVHRA